MKLDRWNLAGLLFVALGFALAAWFDPRLPDPVPTHWNLAGEVDGWTPKPWGVWILPLVALGCWSLLLLVPAISPRDYRMDAFRRVLSIVQFSLALFLFGVTWIALLAASGADVNPGRFILPALGVLLIVIGNFLGKTRRNFFLGIRTPWTLASPEVWSRTHRVGGWLLVLCGGWLILLSFLDPVRVEWIVIPLLIVSFFPIVHSYLLYRRVEGFPRSRDDDPDA